MRKEGKTDDARPANPTLSQEFSPKEPKKSPSDKSEELRGRYGGAGYL
jgi:hypothetical protein